MLLSLAVLGGGHPAAQQFKGVKGCSTSRVPAEVWVLLPLFLGENPPNSAVAGGRTGVAAALGHAGLGIGAAVGIFGL